MELKKFRPLTPGQRHKVAVTFDEITTSKPEKSLLAKKNRSGGRNGTGKMTIENIGGGHKQRYRIIDFKRDKFDIPAKVATIEYDPNRTANIALLHYVDGEKRYMIAPSRLEVGMEVISSKDAPIKVGNTLPLANLPLGTMVHNIELRPGQGAILVRSAGSSAQLMAKDDKYAVIKLASGEIRKILMTCLATIGTVSNPQHQLESHGKAGRRRWLGRRPNVRATVKNPVDHPMGGGEAKSSGGHPRNKNGVPAKGFKTRDKKKTSSKYIIERRKKN
jgi:large subunit ribosomal protein L2